jgi:ketosteroid isomerase-like protein
MPERQPHPHEEMLRAIYADLSLLGKFASEDIVLHAYGSRDIMAGDYVGKQAVLAREAELYRRSGGSLAMTADHVVANDSFGAVLGRFTANRNGTRFVAEVCGLWRFADGLIVEHWEHCADWPAAERFLVDWFTSEPGSAPASAHGGGTR